LKLLTSEASMHSGNPARYFERMLTSLAQHDDIAIMSVRFSPKNDRKWSFDCGEPAVAYALQRTLIDLATSASNASDEEANACELILSELIGNAVRHAPGSLSISVSINEAGVWLHLIDEGPGFEFRSDLPEDLWAESGRGLFLIAALARSVSSEPLPGRGNYIRVCLPLSVLEPSQDTRLST
jgi:anti-sigma regulatory factor (Ser/Thr protein kinase)